MAPATEECAPGVVSRAQDAVDPADDVESPASADSFCCRCCACWQRRVRSRPPRGTDKVGGTEKETLLSGGKTRFYCCESKMTTRPGRGPNRIRRPRNSASEPPETAVAVSPGLCSIFKFRGRRKDSDCDERGVPPVDIAYDAFDERAYMEEFELIHREEYDVSRTIVNPIVPHSEILLHPSQVGRAIIIKGKIYPNAQRIAVNLVCSGRNDIAMHFNPRLDRGYIARNTKLNGHWGAEENSLNGPSPFQPDQEFTLHILVTDEEFRFCHNGRHICSYQHRVPIARLHLLDIHGDLTVSMVRHEMMEHYPPTVPPVPVEDLLREPHLLSVGHTPLLIPTTHSWRADIPKQSYFFLGRFQPNLAIGNEIIIGGYVRLLPHAFFLNLQDGLQMWKPPEVHLHINPRFEDHNHTIVNARLKGTWGYEERHSRCHFQPGRPFTLIIRVEKDRYRVLVNDSVLASMHHRARPSEINSLYISGDVDITSIGFNTALSISKSSGSKKGVTIAESSDWVGAALDDEDSSIRRTNDTERSVSESPLPGGAQEIDLSSVEVKEGNKIFNLWKPGRENLNANGSQQANEEITSVSIEPPQKSVITDNLEFVPQPSTSKAVGLPIEKQSGSVEIAGQVGRRASHESTVPETQKEDTVSVNSESLLRSENRGSATAVSSQVEPPLKDVLNDSTEETVNLSGEPPQLQADVNRNPALTYSSETETVADGRNRADSIISDEIFLSAQHSLEPSIASKRNSLDESYQNESVSSASRTKTDKDKNSNGRNSKES